MLARRPEHPSIRPFRLVFHAPHPFDLVGLCHPHGRKSNLWELWMTRYVEFEAETTSRWA